MFTKFAASQTDIADLFQVERKKFFTSITGREYEAGKKQTKAEKTKMAETTAKEKATPGQEEPQPTAATEVDPEMPPLEDIRPKKKFRFKDPESTPRSKHFPN